jgi:hypothetical protein
LQAQQQQQKLTPRSQKRALYQRLSLVERDNSEPKRRKSPTQAERSRTDLNHFSDKGSVGHGNGHTLVKKILI